MNNPDYLIHFNPFHSRETGQFIENPNQGDRPRGNSLWEEDLNYLSSDHTNLASDNFKLPDDYKDWFEEMCGKTVVEKRINEQTGEVETWLHRIGGKLNE